MQDTPAEFAFHVLHLVCFCVFLPFRIFALSHFGLDWIVWDYTHLFYFRSFISFVVVVVVVSFVVGVLSVSILNTNRWGNGSDGALGQGDFVSRATPTLVAEENFVSFEPEDEPSSDDNYDTDNDTDNDTADDSSSSDDGGSDSNKAKAKATFDNHALTATHGVARGPRRGRASCGRQLAHHLAKVVHLSSIPNIRQDKTSTHIFTHFDSH